MWRLFPFVVVRKFISLLCLVLLSGLAFGCANTSTPPPEQILFNEPPVPPTEIPTLLPSNGGEPGTPPVLRVWVVPEFNPALDTLAAQLFQARLDEFTQIHPEVRIEIRVKAATGPGGMIEALNTTTAAAPEVLPDLVALPRAVMENAAPRGLLSSLDSYAFIQQDTDWYGFAQEMARIQNNVFGVPFACDALVLVYRPEVVAEPPRDWTTTLQLDLPILFPVNSSQALFTLSLYRSIGGEVKDANNRITITPASLSAVLDFYAEAQANGVIMPTPASYRSERDTFNAFLNEEADMVIAWASDFWNQAGADAASSALPTPGGVPFTIVTGWVWALSNPSSAHHELSAELLQFLTDSTYLSQWTEAAGYLPPRPSSLSTWTDPIQSAMASRLVLSANLIPPSDVIATLGPLLQEAVLAVLNGEQAPSQAAENVSIRLNAP